MLRPSLRVVVVVVARILRRCLSLLLCCCHALEHGCYVMLRVFTQVFCACLRVYLDTPPRRHTAIGSPHAHAKCKWEILCVIEQRAGRRFVHAESLRNKSNPICRCRLLCSPGAEEVEEDAVVFDTRVAVLQNEKGRNDAARAYCQVLCARWVFNLHAVFPIRSRTLRHIREHSAHNCMFIISTHVAASRCSWLAKYACLSNVIARLRT